MDRFVIREPRSGEYPQGNQMMAFPANANRSNMIPPEIMYFGGPFASEYQIAQHNIATQPNLGAQHNMGAHSMAAHHYMGAQPNMGAQHNMGAQPNMSAQHNMGAQPNMGANENISAQNNIEAHHNLTGQRNLNAQHNMSAQHNMVPQHVNAQHNTGVQQNMNSQMAQSFGQNPLAGQMSGIDSRYLAGYTDNSAQFIVSGQQIQRNATPINCSFGSDYQNRSFNGIDKNKEKNFAHVSVVPQPKKPNELNLFGNDTQNQIMSRADKLKALQKTGLRAFSGPVEKVLKWHKSLQDIGVLILYEIVAKCVSVRQGESGSKVLVVRDDSGPAMQVVYYEIDFLLPELKPPCTIRVVGRMMAGTCRLQAFSVRPAAGDDVAALPRRAAVAAHHIAKLCKEYGPNVQ